MYYKSYKCNFYINNKLYSSSSSSPLLSLVQVPAKLAINLSIHTQHTYDNGVDRTGDRVFRKIQLLHEEREEEKKMFNPQTMLHLEYSLRTEKKTPQHKSTYTINTWLATGGTYPALASSHPVQCHLFRRRSQTCSTGGGKKRYGKKRYRGSWMGEGNNVCSRGWEQETASASLSQGGYPDGLGQGAGTGSQKR